MLSRSRVLATLIALTLLLSSRISYTQSAPPTEECTAGVACARATTDGRPILWKSRDADAIDNEVIWNTSGRLKFLAVVTAGNEKSSWMELNEKGFAICSWCASLVC